ncbi:MAG: VWA domain-containing protein [Planctomycetota bacterium]|nr:VWA domain-containing protein [Planctomycetota bacterium]
MLELEFENLSWTQAIWGVLVMGVLLVWLEIRRNRLATQFVSKSMQSRLARTASLGSRLAAHTCFLGALVCFVLALMRPQYGFTEKEFPQVGAQIMICLDVSKSMLAEDTAPNRLDRAKSELEVLLNYLRGDQVGLIAFAGKATVLCPMTTDFGFLKMLLREASPTSVGRGGTLLEKPIRRAMAGFSDTSEMSKVVVLITDGEDNGSKPTDAAKEAAERGIKIITIGFGDEKGTKIEITNPRTGLAEYLQDQQGQDVVSRLDISTLTKIATLSDGAFIPARLGSLDVESIHKDHIEPLMRARTSRKQVVKNEAYQWPLLAGIVMFGFSMVLSNTLAFSRTRFGDWLEARTQVQGAFFLFLLLTGANSAVAQQLPATQDLTGSESRQENDTDSRPIGGEFTSRTLEDLVPDDPLECYNQAADILYSDTRFAEKLLESARRNSGDNAELRFRSSYNLGWVKLNQANRDLEEKPEEALKHLEESANWFRESVRLRPKSQPCRENLEIVLRRIAELSDKLNKKNPQDLGQQLDELIQRQAQLVEGSRQLLEQSGDLENKNEFSEPLLKSFRLASVDQRLLVSDLNDISQQANQRVEKFRQQQQKKPVAKENTVQQEQLKMAQISQSLIYLDRAAQRLGQARSQLRLKNGQRAALRSSLGLDELKRARDQLRDPVGILRQIIADTQLLNQQTNALLAGKNRFAAFLGSQVELPKWLDTNYLKQFQMTQGERCRELEAVLLAVSAEPASSVEGAPSQGVPDDSRQKIISQAAELVGAARSSCEMASQDLGHEKIRAAEPKQRSAISSLQAAYELFADLKGLLELTYAQQLEVNGRLGPGANLKGSVRSQVAEQLVRKMVKNLDRIDRIENLVIEKSKQSQPDVEGNDLKSNSEPAVDLKDQGEIQKLERAKTLIDQVRLTSLKLKEDLTESQVRPEQDRDWKLLLKDGELAEQQLNKLRRLFFSVVEQLQETVDRQNQLNGDSNQSLGQSGQEKQTSKAEERLVRRTAPLKSRQDELASIAEGIGNTLEKTVEASGQSVNAGNQTNETQVPEREMLEKYAQAAKLVFKGKQAMDEASRSLVTRPVAAKEVRQSQEEALKDLVAALTLLNPSDDNPNDPKKQPKNSTQEEQAKKGNEGSGLARDTTSRQAFQGIRDREAQRRKDRQKNRFQERVEKDW